MEPRSRSRAPSGSANDFMPGEGRVSALDSPGPRTPPDIPPERQALRENMHRGTGCADAVLREPQGTGHPGAERSEARPWASVVTPEHLRLACGCSGGVKPAGRKQARPAEIFNGRMP